MASLSDRAVVRPNVVFRVLESEAVILNLDSGMYFGLNEMGTRIWQLLEHHDVAAVCKELEADYDAPADRIQGEVLALVEALESKGLIDCRPDP